LFLLDTNIVSATSPVAAAQNTRPPILGWLELHGSEVYLSSVTIAEIWHGIHRAERLEAITKAKRLRNWVALIENLYGNRVLPFGSKEAYAAGAILDRARAHEPGFADIAIAATADANGLTVLTANEKHFGPMGVKWWNPLKELPLSS
jgi:predicted nucleic acid-binding protein